METEMSKLDCRLSAGRSFLISADGTPLKIHPLPESLTAHPAWPPGVQLQVRPGLADRTHPVRGLGTVRRERDRSCFCISNRIAQKPKYSNKTGDGNSSTKNNHSKMADGGGAKQGWHVTGSLTSGNGAL